MTDLHICLNDKATIIDIQTIESINPNDNPYYVIKSAYKRNYSDYGFVHEIAPSFSGYCEIFRQMKKADRIHLNGFFDFKVIVYLATHKKISRKCNWLIMGDDLYSLLRKPKSILSRMLKICRTKAIKNFYSVSTPISGDKKLLEDYLKKNIRFYKFCYGNESIEGIPWPSHKSNSEIRVLLGNSATETNCHIEALDLLSKFKDEEIHIYCPLSYGQESYKEKIIKHGEGIFGDKFVPLVSFMPREEYLALLGSIDVAVFAHNRQQAMGNILPLIYAGKKVYIKETISSYEYLKSECGFKITPFEKIVGESFEEFRNIDFDINEQRSQCRLMANDDIKLMAYKACLISENNRRNEK